MHEKLRDFYKQTQTLISDFFPRIESPATLGHDIANNWLQPLSRLDMDSPVHQPYQSLLLHNTGADHSVAYSSHLTYFLSYSEEESEIFLLLVCASFKKFYLFFNQSIIAL